MSDVNVETEKAVQKEQPGGENPTNVEGYVSVHEEGEIPQLNKGKRKKSTKTKRSKRPKTTISSSESEGESDRYMPESDNGSSSSSSLDSSEEGNDSIDEETRTSKTSDSSDYIRFDVMEEEKRHLSLPEDMEKYLLKSFSKFTPDKVLNEKILDKYPLPSHVKALKLDDYVQEIFSSSNSSYGKPYDQNLAQIQGRVGTVMVPLSRLWLDLENIRKAIKRGTSSDTSLDIFDCLGLVEKSITLLGQAFTTTTYHRRMNVLYNLTKDVKKAKQLLKSNDEKLSDTGKLFGKKFYKALVKASSTSKKSKEISRQLGKKHKKFRPERQERRDAKQPFRHEAPRRGPMRGGRVSFTRGRGHQPSNRGKRVYFTSGICRNSNPGTAGSRKEVHTGACSAGIRSKLVTSDCKGPQSLPSGGRFPHGGRLRFFLQNWEKLTQDSFILLTVQGMQIPFMEIPVQTSFQNQPPSLKNATLIDVEVQDMLQKGAIIEVLPCKDQILSPVFLVPKKDGGNRPVIILKKLNQYIEYQHFKMEGIQALKSLIKKGDYMVKLDLKDAYFSLPIHKAFRKYLRFAWKGKIYEYQVLGFGLAVGPRYFTKTLKPVIAFLRRLGIRIVIYLDDMILLNQCSQMLMKDLTSLRWLLENLGFLINWKKSVIVPLQEIQFLGFLINSVEMLIMLPSEKITRIVGNVRS